MSRPLSNRLDRLEADVLQSMPVSHNVHIIDVIVNPDGSVHEELETIIQNGIVIASMRPRTKEQPCPATR